MPQLASITLDGLAGADHVFLPRDITNGVATLVNTLVSGAVIGDERLTVSVVSTTSGKQKVTLRLAVPKVQDVVIGGISRPTVVKTAYAELTFSSDATGSADDRGEIVLLVRSLLSKDVMWDVIAGLQRYY